VHAYCQIYRQKRSLDTGGNPLAKSKSKLLIVSEIMQY